MTFGEHRTFTQAEEAELGSRVVEAIMEQDSAERALGQLVLFAADELRAA